MRKATVEQTKVTSRQTELQLSPYIVLDYKNDLLCRNIGNSPAINVEVSTIEFKAQDSEKLVFRVSFLPLYVLEPKEDKKIETEINFEDKELEAIVNIHESTGEKFFPFFPEETKKDEYPILIEYENIENVKYKTSVIIKCREKKIKVLNIERVA